MNSLKGLIDYFSKDQKKFRRELVSAAVDIFHSYETQFTNIEPKSDLLNLAEDAAYRLLSYFAEENEVTPECFFKAIIGGESKNFRFLCIKKLKYEVSFGLNSPKKACKTENLFNKVGLVDETSVTYYVKRNNETKPEIYGFRRLLNNERREKIEQEYVDYNLVVEHIPYFLNPDLTENMKDEIYKHINDKDPNLRDERLTNTIVEGMRNMIDERLKEHIDDKKSQRIIFDLKDPTHLFGGRSEDIDELHSKIHRQSGRVTAITQSTAVSGLGGIGKTELARKYASLYSTEYRHIIWIDAERNDMISSFKRLAKEELQIRTKNIEGDEMSIKGIVKEVYKSFAKQTCLFIFDNVEEAREIKEFLPPNMLEDEASHWYFLITSRWNKWDKDIELINLNVLKLDDAILLVRNGLKDNSQCEENHIKELAVKLQCFPLALRQAIAYINERRIDIKQYLEDYDKEVKTYLNYKPKNQGLDDFSKTTFTVWKMTIDKIQSDEKYGEKALQILQIMAYIAPDKISEDIFFSTFSEEDTDEAISLLEKYSLIEETEDKPRILSIHRLVQETTRLNLEDKTQQVLFEVMDIIENNLDKNLDHAVSAWNHVQKEEKILRKFSFLLSKIIDELKNAVRYEEASSFGRRALEFLITVLGKDNEHCLSSDHSIAEVIYKQGKYEEALNIFDDVLQRKTRTLGENHASTLFTKLRKAVVLNNKGYYEKCLQLCQEIIDKKEGWIDSENLSAMHEKARALDNLGRYGEAVKAYEDRLCHDNNENFSKESSLHSWHGYGRALCNHGQYFKALEVYQKVLNERKQFGEKNPDYLATKNNIAVVRNKLGEYDEALKIFYEVEKVRIEVLGKEHPSTLYTQHGIAKVLKNKGMYKESSERLQAVLKKRKEVLGNDHPATLSTRHEYAVFLSTQGKHQTSLGKLQNVYKVRKHKLGDKHPSTLSTLHEIAVAYRNCNEYDLALKYLEIVYERRKKVLRDTHSSTLTTLHEKAVTLKECSRNQEALIIFQETYKKKLEELKEKHPSTILTRNYIE